MLETKTKITQLSEISIQNKTTSRKIMNENSQLIREQQTVNKKKKSKFPFTRDEQSSDSNRTEGE